DGVMPGGGPGRRNDGHCAAWRGWLLDLWVDIFRWADYAARARQLVAQISLRVVRLVDRFRALAHCAWRVRLRARIRVELSRFRSHGWFGCRRSLSDCRRGKQNCGRRYFKHANSADHCTLPSALSDADRVITAWREREFPQFAVPATRWKRINEKCPSVGIGRFSTNWTAPRR